MSACEWPAAKTVLEHDDVRPPRLARQLVFEDGRPGARRVVRVHLLPALALQPRDRLVPGPDLLGARVAHELLEAQADDAGLGAVERREIGEPAAGGGG